MILKIKKELNFASGKGLLDIDTNIEEGSFMAISGVSGSGKTTLLRIIAGLTRAIAGKIEINGHTWYDSTKKINLPPQKRRVGYVFQNYALFPNMTVRQNLVYALEKNQPKTIIDELIEIVELEALAKKYPYRLSGGQQQRVALARALVRKPAILLLDEPLSALDSEMRSRLQDYLIKIHKGYQLTTLLVSHDVSEILRMADQVMVLEKGKIIKKGRPDAILLDQEMNGDYKFLGEILQIIPNEKKSAIIVRILTNEVKIEVSKEELQGLKIGDKITLVADRFHRVI